MKYLWRTLAAIVLIVLLLLAGLAIMLGSQGGSRWLLGQVPGLTVEGFDGRLGRRWQAERLLWAQGERRAELSAVELAWRPSCLLRLTLCLERLGAGQVKLDFPPGPEEEAAAPIRLPELKLPLAVELGEVDLGPVTLNDGELLQRLALGADWTATGLEIESLEVQRSDLTLRLQGRLTPSGDWPLSATGDLDLRLAPGEQPWQVRLSVQGALQGSLELVADSTGYLPGRLEGSLQPLAERLPARLRLTADGFKAAPGLPDTLRLDQLELNVAGDLQDGYRILGTARLPGEGGVVPLAVDGRVSARGAELATLKLDAGKDRQVVLSGQADWSDGLAAEAKIDWQDFPWLWLYPMEPPPVALERLNGEVSYRDGNYLGHFAAALSGPAGPFSLESPFSGDLGQVHLPQLQLVAGQGRAEGQLSLRFADGIGWRTDLQLRDFDPSYWLAELAGTLGGPLRSEGEVKDGQLRLEAAIDLSGRLRGQSTRFQIEANGADMAWNVPRLDLLFGDNRIQGSGRLDDSLQGQLQLALPKLAQLWPGLQGQVHGRLDLAGSLQAPQGRLALDGRQLGLAEQRIERLALNATLDGAQRGRLELKGSGIRSGETVLGSLTAMGQGDRHEQSLTLDLDGPLLQLALALDGRLEEVAAGWDWRGRLGRGELQSGGQDWRLQRAATLERLADGSLTLGEHCWRSGAASLCAERQQRLLPEPHLDLRLRDFPLDSLAAFWPQDFAWQGRLDGQVQLQMPQAGPRGQIRLDASNGVLRIREEGQWQDFPYRQLRLDSQLEPDQVDLRLDFGGAQLGELSLRAQIDPRPQDKPLTGEFSLRGFDLSVIRPFAGPVGELEGQLNGSGTLRGSLQQPQIDGRLTLRDGLIAGGELPTRFEDFQLEALINGESLQLDGRWRSGEQGRGSLSGSLDWRDALDVDLQIRGNRLPVTVEPYATLEVEPDLRVQLAGEQLALSGRVLVPRGKIEIRELPPSTVKVSEDTVVVGREPEAGAALDMQMDIDVEVGQDRLTFSGFGLTAQLAGHLHVGNDLDTRGELNLNEGRYRAYGQRLDIRRARLLFIGPIDQPYLDIEAIRKVEEVVAGLRVAGSALQPRTEVFSEPAMSQEQALSYLILGRPLGADTGEDSNLLARAALGLGLAGSSGATGSLAERLGIEEFELGTEGSGAETSLVASGKLSERLSLIYGVGVFEPLNTIALRYRLSRWVFLEAASGLASSLDIFYKRDF